MNDSAKEHERWMSEALVFAEYAFAHDEVPVGAIVVLDGLVIGRGWNQVITQSDPTAHAEMMALRDAAKTIGNHRLVGATLYSTAEPCTMCTGALVHARVEQLVFAAREPKAGGVVSTNQLLANPWFNHRVKYIEDVMAEKSCWLLQQFFQTKRGR